MASREPITIELGGKSFTIRPFTINQVEASEKVASQGLSGLAASIGLLKVALSRDYANVDVGEVEATPIDLADCMTKIMVHMGVKQKSPTPGEMLAAAETATSIGEISAAA